jgi:hypothetical protein
MAARRAFARGDTTVADRLSRLAHGAHPRRALKDLLTPLLWRAPVDTSLRFQALDGLGVEARTRIEGPLFRATRPPSRLP